MPRQHKQFHFTGLYGIILLIPALIFFYGFKANVLVAANAIPIDVEDYDTRYILHYTKPNRPFKIFTLTGIKNEELNAVKEIRLATQKMMVSKDTVTGIKVRLEPKASYNAFIQVYKLFAEEHVEFYGIGDDMLWAIYPSDAEKKESEYFE